MSIFYEAIEWLLSSISKLKQDKSSERIPTNDTVRKAVENKML